MIKKFVDEFENTYVFIEEDDKLIKWLNGNCEYTFTEIASMPKTIKEADEINSLNIWYPINEIEC